MSLQPTITAIAYSTMLKELVAVKESLSVSDIVKNLVMSVQVVHGNGDSSQLSVNNYALSVEEGQTTIDFYEAVEFTLLRNGDSIIFTNLDIENIEKLVEKHALRNDSPIIKLVLEVYANDTIDLYMMSPIVGITVTYSKEKNILGRGLDALKRLINK